MIQTRGFSGRLTIGLVLVVLIVSGAALATLHLYAEATARRANELTTFFQELLSAQRLRANVEEAVASSRGYLLTGRQDFIDRMDQSQEAARQLLASLESRVRSPEGRRLLSEMVQAARAYDDNARAAVDGKKRGDSPAAVAHASENELIPGRRRLAQLLDEFLDLQQREFRLGSERLEREWARALFVVVGTLAFGVLLSCALALALTRHLTGLYRREQAAIAAAERAAAAREELLATVAHDLRSPLGAIGLRAATLRRQGDERGRKQGEAIDRVVRRMEQLVRGLLDAATIEAGRFSIQPSSFPIAALVREVFDLFGDSAAARSIALECRAAADLLVRADRERVMQVVSNLVVNAIKFVPPGGRIEVDGHATQDDKVQVSVRDTGAGIPPDRLVRVFERFWKADPAERAGTGLGLHIAREIVRAHGGRIWVESQTGCGTTFHFTLPAGPQVATWNATETASTAPPAAQQSPASIQG